MLHEEFFSKYNFYNSPARSCGQPPDPGNGWHAGECYTYGCRVLYQCGSGYEIVGKAERYCQADGSWVPKELPTCVCKYSSKTKKNKFKKRQIANLFTLSSKFLFTLYIIAIFFLFL